MIEHAPMSRRSPAWRTLAVLLLALLAAPVHGGFTGLVSEPDPAGEGAGVFVCNVYATFDDPTDRLLSIGFANIQPGSGGALFQDPANTRIPSALPPQTPAAPFDTFLTIDLDVDPLGQVSSDPDLTESTSGISGGCFIIPDEPLGFPDGSGRILVARITSAAPGIGASGPMTLYWTDAAGGCHTEPHVLVTACQFGVAIPTVGTWGLGALALLLTLGAAFVIRRQELQLALGRVASVLIIGAVAVITLHDTSARGGSPCSSDINGDGAVGPPDLAAVLCAWGDGTSPPEDLDGDGDVGPSDLAQLLAEWGPCP